MTFSPETTRAWVDVDLAALVANARTVAAVSGSRLLPMVKANGYGLGATEVARALETVDPWGFGVASIDEARQLREAGIQRPILVMTPLLSQCIEQYFDLQLRPTIGDLSGLESWIARGERPFHIEFDTGMSRTGIRWDDRASSRPACHLAAARERLGRGLHSFSCRGVRRRYDRASVGALSGGAPCAAATPTLDPCGQQRRCPRGKTFAGDLVRPGIYLYGGAAASPSPQPVAALRARVVAVRAIAAGDTVGYGATWRAERPTTVCHGRAGVRGRISPCEPGCRSGPFPASARVER